MTSLNPKSHRVFNDQAGDTLSPEFLTVADILRSHGYYCGALTGSGLVSAIFGFSKGFDEYHEDRYSIFKGDSAETLFENTSAWLNHNCDKKFFLFLHTYQPHNPYKNNSSFGNAFLSEHSEWQEINLMRHLRDLNIKNPISYSSELEARAKRILEKYLFRFRALPDKESQNIVDLYDGEIRHTDEYLVKPLLSELKRLNIYENTMIILVSDHGEGFGDHKMWEHAVQLYNELIRVPLIIKFPASKHRGSTIANNVGIIDILPSILEELGITPHSQFEGKHVHDIINGVEDMERVCYSETRTAGRKISVVRGNDKLIFNGAPKSVYNLIGIPKQIEYYDLYKDHSEKNNIEVSSKTDLNVLFNHLIEYWEDARDTGGKPQRRAKIPEDLKEQLKALGYIK
jgi:arylsulfatase A-like enzyme